MTPPKDFTVYYNDPKHSDMVLVCDTKRYSVHKVILCAPSSYFKALCEKGFKEADSTEVKLEDDDPIAFECALRCIYGHTYGDALEQAGADSQDIAVQMQVFQVADKYDITCVRELAVEQFKTNLRARMSNLTSNENDVMSAIRSIYASGLVFEKLQHDTEEICILHMDNLMKLKSFGAMVKDMSPFTAALLTKEPNAIGKLRCNYCSREFQETAGNNRVKCPNGCTNGFTRL